jgi:hypothetical protein
MMKHWKITLILLVALLLLSLSACGEKTNETTAPSDTGPSDSTTVYEDPIPDLSGEWFDADDVLSIGVGYDGYLDGQLLYRVNDEGALCVLDLTTKEETLVCAREDCTHHKAFCDAYFGYENYYIDGYLYRRSGDTLVRCRLDGTERTELLTMGELDLGDRFYKNVWPVHFQVTESAIYYTLRAEYGVDLGDFNFATKEIYFLVRFDMESGEEEILGEFDEKDVNILAARDDQVLITAREIVELDFEDPEWEEISNNASLSLQVWDAGYESFVTVKEDACGVFAPYEIKDGKLLYTNYKDWKHYCYDPVTETDTVIGKTEDRTVFGGKYVIIYDYDISNNYLALAETGEKVHNDFGDLRMSVRAYDDEGFVFEASRVEYPEGEDYGEFVEQTTYYVRFADMEDGLHDYDCILLDHWEREE